MKTSKKLIISQELPEHRFTRFQAVKIVTWLREEKNKQVPGGWTRIHMKTANEIAGMYGVTSDEINSAAGVDPQDA